VTQNGEEKTGSAMGFLGGECKGFWSPVGECWRWGKREMA